MESEIIKIRTIYGTQRRSKFMRRTSIKRQRLLIIAVLILFAVTLAGGIYININQQNSRDHLQAIETSKDVAVDEIDKDKEILDVEALDGTQRATVEVQPIDDSDLNVITDSEVQEDTIEEPMPTAPEIPESTPPSKTPQTSDNLENKDQIPTYSEEETTFTPEVTELEEPVVSEEQETSNLVPDAQNPFLQNNIPSNGDSGEMNGSDLGDGVWGTGDKF